MPSAQSILVDGSACDHVDVRDRGLAFGDGLFETIAVVNGRALNWTSHRARLSAGCARLDIPPPDPLLLETEILAVAESTDTDRCVVKVIISRGVGGNAYTPPANPRPTRIVMSRPWPGHYAEKSRTGIRVGLAAHPLSVNPRLAGLKHLNRLDQVLASAEMKLAGWDEALMRDPAGGIIEATRSNVFIVERGALSTPALGNCGVAGIMRANVMSLAPELNLPVSEREMAMEDIARADELFVCNAIAGLWPVIALAGAGSLVFPIGPVTLALREALLAAGRHP